MKLREKIFLLELGISIFLAYGIAGNGDLGIDTPIKYWIVLIILMSLTFLQMKYIEIKERRRKYENKKK